MTLVTEVAKWRAQLTEDRDKDGEPPPTEEDVLGMLVFDAVSDLLEHHWEEVLAYLNGTDDEPKFLVRWLDRKAQA